MRIHNIKAILKAAAQVVSLLLFGAVAGFAQQTINLTAAPTTVTLPDGKVVPMWGYFCGAAAGGTTTATCAALNPASVSTVATVPSTWSPVVITVPYVSTGTSLTINLTNSLTFAPTGGGTANPVPTSLTIVGQLGGGLGTTGATCTDAMGVHGVTCTTPPDHSNSQYITWPIADPTTTNAPPAQANRVQSFATEVAAGATTPLT